MNARPAFDALVRFNIEVLAQARAVAQAYAGRTHAYAEQIGPHLRHIVEHYESLLESGSGLVDYDHRAHDRGLETSPEQTVARLATLEARLEALPSHAAAESLTVGFVTGLAGEDFVLSPSTLARELNFVASHAIHHFAIIRPRLAAAGIAVPEFFGKAPETVRHERRQ